MVDDIMSANVTEPANRLASLWIVEVLKGEPVEPVDPAFPNVIAALDLFDTQGRMVRVILEQFEGFQDLILDFLGQVFSGFLELMSTSILHSSLPCSMRNSYP